MIKNKVLNCPTISWHIIKTWEFNQLKDNSNRDVSKLVKSITNNGFITPFDCWKREDGKPYIIDGTGRYQALLQLETDGVELPELPVLFIEAKDLKEAKKFALQKSSQHGQITEASLSEFTVDFAPIELQDLMAEELNLEGLEESPVITLDPDTQEDDFDPTPPEVAKTVLGDLYEIGPHRLLCGDSTDTEAVGRLMNNKLADMVFTDPPWNVNYGGVEKGNAMGYKPRQILNDSMSTGDFKDFMTSTFAVMSAFSKKGCPTYVVMSAQEWGNLMIALLENDYHWSSTIIWNKSSLILSRKDYHTKYEPIWYGWLNGGPRLCPLIDRKQSDVWDIERPSRSDLHPTTKPIALVGRALENSSRQGNLVMELFTGSGSTMIACHQLKRQCYGMELDPKYCDVIVSRMIKEDPSLTVTKNGIDCTNQFKKIICQKN
jgi:DNA modification methylase